MTTNEQRLRKYARRRESHHRVGRRDEWVIMLYWRYWHKVHGTHECIWEY